MRIREGLGTHIDQTLQLDPPVGKGKSAVFEDAALAVDV